MKDVSRKFSRLAPGSFSSTGEYNRWNIVSFQCLLEFAVYYCRSMIICPFISLSCSLLRKGTTFKTVVLFRKMSNKFKMHIAIIKWFLSVSLWVRPNVYLHCIQSLMSIGIRIKIIALDSLVILVWYNSTVRARIACILCYMSWQYPRFG